MARFWPPPELVMETSTTTGTSDWTLAGAVAGYRAFNGVVTSGFSLYCVARAVDANGIPTGQWEYGEYTFTSPSTLARTTVLLNSTGSGGKLSFSAGTKRIYPFLASFDLAYTAAEYRIPYGGTAGRLDPTWLPGYVPDHVLSNGGGLVVNPEGSVWQATSPGSATAMADAAYNGPDCWYSLIQGTNPTIQRTAGTAGRSKNSVKIIAGGTTNRYGVAQIVESQQSVASRGLPLSLRFKVRPTLNAGSGTMDIRYAVLSWTGTADTVTKDVVNNWASGTFTGGNFFVNSNLTVERCLSDQATHNVWLEVDEPAFVTATSNSCNNLILFIWSEDVPGHAADFLEISEVELVPGEKAPPYYHPRHPQQEVAFCQRYYNKSYALDTAPGTASQGGYVASFAATTRYVFNTKHFPVAMRASPTITLYDFAGTSGKATRFSTGLPVGSGAMAAASGNQLGFPIVDETGVFVAGEGYYYHYTADARL